MSMVSSASDSYLCVATAIDALILIFIILFELLSLLLVLSENWTNEKLKFNDPDIDTAMQ